MAEAWGFDGVVGFDAGVADGYMKHHVLLPADVADGLAAGEVSHVEGEVAGVAFRRTVQRASDGAPCLKFGATWLRAAGLDVGQPVGVRLWVDPDPARVDLPAELESALEADPEAEHVWSTWSTSRRKTTAYHVDRAKRRETRERRAAAVVAELRAEAGLPATPAP